MGCRILPEARDELRDAVRYYRAIKPPVVGKQLAQRVLGAFRQAVQRVEATPLARPEHPEIPGVRFVLFTDFPYLAFYTVTGGEIVVIAVEYATSDYVERVERRLGT